MQKEVIWPIGNKSIYKIKFFVSDYSTTEEYYYSLFVSLVDDNNNTLIFSKSHYDNEKYTMAWLSDCFILAREVLDVAYFIAKVFGTRILRSRFFYGKMSYFEPENPLFCSFYIEKECVLINMNSSKEYPSGRKSLRISDVINLDTEYIRENWDKIFK